ncbi:MAG: precorrin-6A/cobalt-precorrin-6A reductase, partial [Eubacteriaceae bacterium]|nr:precorrin-6A/cobalt-precorrin-6A reductase [Eubacteriaceae bacterium]
TSSVLKKCEDLGFSPGNILALQGPFSEELNQAMYQEYQIKYMVTKDSGSIGGVREKILPALKMGIQVLILKRP